MQKTVLVTGSAKGIGAATIIKFAKNGYNVVINYLNSEEKALSLKEYVENNFQIKALLVKADVSKESEVKRMLEIILQNFETIDCVVNNAAITIDDEYYDKTEDELKEEENIYEPVYKIVMINESDAIDEILEKDNTVNLILTGNSLGGTVKLPFVGPLFKEDGSKKYSDSYYKVNNTEIYVSNGLGTNSTKMRLFNNPSFNLYRLKSNN